MAAYSIIVTVDPASDFNAVLENCQQHGLQSAAGLPRLSLVRGIADQTAIEALRSVPGVRAVEREREIQLPPPGSRVQ